RPLVVDVPPVLAVDVDERARVVEEEADGCWHGCWVLGVGCWVSGTGLQRGLCSSLEAGAPPRRTPTTQRPNDLKPALSAGSVARALHYGVRTSIQSR